MTDKKSENKTIQGASSLSLENRKILSITGVNEVINWFRSIINKGIWVKDE